MRARRQPLSKTGYEPETMPLLVLWGARALYLGPAFGLSAHRNAVAVLAVGVEATFGVARHPLDRTAGFRPCRTALIAPNKLHHLQTRGVMAFLYLDPLSRDYEAARERAGRRGDGVAFDLGDEAAIVDCLKELRKGSEAWPETEPELARHLGLHAPQHIDQRIANAITSMRNNPSHETDAATLARDAGLSVSRFLHLFKETTGVPFRRYRIWCRLGAVVRAAKAGALLTDAAHAAGLSSSAHLSAAFRDMFGLAPSDLSIQNFRVIAVK